MLRTLSIRDFAIVDRLELEFGPGFAVLTGETGAGKSILVEALALVLGARADALVVREGAARAEVSAAFDAAAAATVRWLEENDLTGDEDECVLRRVIEPAGRSRAYVNGRPATLAQLRELGGMLVEIHGQHEHQLLVRAPEQRRLLDDYGGHTNLADEMAAHHRLWQERRAQRLELEQNAAAASAQRDELDWQVRELESLALADGEWQELASRHGRLAHAASLAAAAQFGVETLLEGETSSLAGINQVAARLAGLVAFDPALRDVAEALEAGRIQVQEAAQALRRYGDRIEVNPHELAQLEARIDAVNTLARKHRIGPDELPGRLAALRERLALLEAGGDVTRARAREEEALARCVELAARLTAARTRSAARLGERVTAAMQELAMAGGRFEVVLRGLAEPSAQGFEAVEFLVAGHKGMEPLPLARVASGGELSRLSLAVQSAAAGASHVPTLIFDEIDAGVGGRAAEIVGRMLAALGRDRQVMCITHLPQVAAAADRQWQVAKRTSAGRVVSRVRLLGRDERIEEIARMLGGVTITETTRRHAAEMLGTKL